MKRPCFATVLALAAGCAIQVSADTNAFNFTTGFANSGAVPDGNATGWFDTRTISGLTDPAIADVNVSLTITGGYAGDFYAYLSHSSGFSVLLNRVGRSSGNPFGYDNASLNITLDDSAVTGEIHAYQTISGYSTLISNGSTWSPDGRSVSPLLALDTDSRTRLLNQFNGLDPNGDWTLFIADVSGGGAPGAVVSWGLNITTVPEPTSLALVAMSGWVVLFRKKFRG
jgi:subtilisin-like proprotein convertase family protein